MLIAVEPVADLIEAEMWPLLVDHREELTTNKALMVLEPDVGKYRDMEQDGVLMGLTARDDDGKLIGYSLNIVSTNLHYASVVMAVNDVFFVSKQHRGSVGLRLIKATEEAAKAKGAHLMVWHAKPNTNLESIFRKREYRVQDVMFTREL